jgi:hypothetical protein
MMGPSEWSCLVGGVILLAYLFGFSMGHKAGEGWGKYQALLEKMRTEESNALE